MKLLITGICGFTGCTLARHLREAQPGLEIFGIDNLLRPGSELNRAALARLGVRFQHADVRLFEDLEALPEVDFILDAAANPSVLAGTNAGTGGSRQLMSHNLLGTVQVLEFCKRRKAGLILLSTSRVYNIAALAALELQVQDDAFTLAAGKALPAGLSAAGVGEMFPTSPPISLYGSTKLCSEILALEYGACFGFPVWINRLGVLAGAGQFGRADQGVFSFWIHSCASQRPLKYIGFGGQGYQVRDCLHPKDLAGILLRQMGSAPKEGGAITNFGGGTDNRLSLRQLHHWCENRFGKRPVESDASSRQYDVPWLVLDNSLAQARFEWKPATPWEAILEEIAAHSEANPNWLELTAG